MLEFIILGFLYLSLATLVLNNLTSIGFFLYIWSDGLPLAEALWTAFKLWITIGFLSGIILLMSFISMKALDKASTKYARRK